MIRYNIGISTVVALFHSLDADGTKTFLLQKQKTNL